MNFPLLTVKSHLLARTNKRFILTGNVGRLFTITDHYRFRYRYFYRDRYC